MRGKPNQLRLARIRWGLSQAELGERALTYQSRVSRIELGIVAATGDEMVRISNALQVPASEIFTEEGRAR